MRLAAWMPAIRATASTSPFGTVPSRSAATTSVEQRTNPRAVAARTVGCLCGDIDHAGVAGVVEVREAHEISMTSTRSPAATASTSAGTIA